MSEHHPWLPTSVRISVGSVYHFTSNDTLIKILESGTLRSSSVLTLNDPGEVKYGWEWIERWLYCRGSKIDEAVARDLLRIVPGERADDDRPSPVLDDYLNTTFVLCASESSNDASQWRLYGDEGRGCVLELATGAVNGLVALETNFEPGSTSWSRLGTPWVTPWVKVLYQEAARNTVIESFFHYFASKWPQMTAIKREREARKLHIIASLIKHDSYESEKEVGTIVLVDDPMYVNYRSSAVGVSSFCNLTHLVARETGICARVGWYPTLPLAGIELGPLTTQASIRATENLLVNAGSRLASRDVRVSKSDIPMRIV